MTSYTPALGSMTHCGFVYDALPSGLPAIKNYISVCSMYCLKELVLLNNVCPLGNTPAGF